MNATDCSLQSGSLSLKYYRFHVPGIGILKSKSKILEAINLGMTVYCYDKIMKTSKKWNGSEWE